LIIIEPASFIYPCDQQSQVVASGQGQPCFAADVIGDHFPGHIPRINDFSLAGCSWGLLFS